MRLVKEEGFYGGHQRGVQEGHEEGIQVLIELNYTP